jgi:hypothetical protein
MLGQELQLQAQLLLYELAQKHYDPDSEKSPAMKTLRKGPDQKVVKEVCAAHRLGKACCFERVLPSALRLLTSPCTTIRTHARLQKQRDIDRIKGQDVKPEIISEEGQAVFQIYQRLLKVGADVNQQHRLKAWGPDSSRPRPRTHAALHPYPSRLRRLPRLLLAQLSQALDFNDLICCVVKLLEERKE